MSKNEDKTEIPTSVSPNVNFSGQQLGPGPNFKMQMSLKYSKT